MYAPENTMIVHSSANGSEADAEPALSSADPNADLFGDWSWKPNRYPEDPGYAFNAFDIALLEVAREMGEEPPTVVWSFPAYDGRDLAFKPRRIGPRI